MFIPPSCIDTLYDYIPLLEKGPLCSLPKSELGSEVAVIGSGAAGMITAHELLKIGLRPIIYEANNRSGGRLYSRYFQNIEDAPFAEMGAMRIPLSSKIFFHYAKKLNLTFDTIFPSPGHADTTIFFRDQTYEWKAHKNPPEPFSTMGLLWDLFVEPLVSRIQNLWKEGDIEKVCYLWQMDIDQYKNMSLYQALKERSPLSSSEQIDIFGALGIGHGGFSPLFQISFLEILRIMVNDYMSTNYLISEGISEFINRLYHFKIKTPLGETSLAEVESLRLNLPVVLLDYDLETNCPIVITKDKNNNLQRTKYKAVVFTGSMCAAHLINITNKTKSGVYLMNSPVREAIKNAPTMASSKTYICTKEKFWKGTNIKPCLVTDDLTRSTYFIDYPLTNYGIVCLSYTWGMDAMKLHAVDPKDRITMFQRSIESIYPGISKNLEPVNGEVLNIDWINEKYQNGAFKIFTPGNDERQKHLYYQFQSVLTEDDKGVYLAGDSVSWSGGWVEGALYTGLNAVFAVAKRLNGSIPDGSPLSQDPDLFEY